MLFFNQLIPSPVPYGCMIALLAWWRMWHRSSNKRVEGKATSDSSQFCSGISAFAVNLIFCVVNCYASCLTWFDASLVSLKMRIDIFHACAVMQS